MSALGTWWQSWSDRYQALQARERQLIALAVLLGVALIGFALAVDPARQRAITLNKQLAQQQTDLASLRNQVNSLKAQRTDPDAATRQALAQVQTSLSSVDAELNQYAHSLVPPEQMGRLLRTLLNRHPGLSLIRLRSLPPETLISPSKEPVAGNSGTAPASQSKDTGGAAPGRELTENLYRQGVEIQIAGTYAELLNYVNELEAAPQKLIWQKLHLQVEAYPRSVLILQLHTLSRKPDWLVL